MPIFLLSQKYRVYIGMPLVVLELGEIGMDREGSHWETKTSQQHHMLPMLADVESF